MVAFITNFADEAVLLPIAIIVGILLLVSRWQRGAIAWLGGVGATLAVIGVLKLLLLHCGQSPGHGGLRSPSGHTAGSTVIYGTLLAGAVRRWAGEHWTLWQAAAATLGCALPVAVLFALTRLELEVHTIPDVLAGGAVGLCGAVLIGVSAGPSPKTVRWRWIGAACLVIVVLLHGTRMPMEIVIHAVAAQLWASTPCANV